MSDPKIRMMLSSIQPIVTIGVQDAVAIRSDTQATTMDREGTGIRKYPYPWEWMYTAQQCLSISSSCPPAATLIDQISLPPDP